MDKIKQIIKDIKSIKIQGATNVALATLEGMKLFIKSFKGSDSDLISEAKKIGEKLSETRDNEPLARNGVKYVLSAVTGGKGKGSGSLKEVLLNNVESYETMITESKKNIVKFAVEALKKEKVVLTHCHSSTAVKSLINVAKLKEINGEDFKVVSTETRPLYQGRKTVKELFVAGIDVTQIVDSACASFISEDKYLPVGAVIVGCDELLKDGSFINKVGTFPIALAAQKGADEFYVATTLLKLGLDSDPRKVYIEERDADEIWKDAPKGLRIINPAFEKVDSKYVTGYVTEAGVLRSSDLLPRAKEMYPWMFEKS